MTLQLSRLETRLATRHVEAPRTRKSSRRAYRAVVKRVVDVTLTLLAAPVVVPLVGLLAVLIMMNGHNPFYSQMRVGRNGRAFRMWKLRTMVADADVLLEHHLKTNPDALQEWEAHQKLRDDPRITWIGALLRKTSADELPQLWNVLNGTMSLVGPRPMMLCQQGDYHGQAYFSLTPGVTGLWQVSDRNHCEFIGRVYYDDLYERTISFKTDMQILFRTVSVVLRGTGY